MHSVRSFFLSSLLLAAPVSVAFAQGAPTKSAAPPAASAKASAQPTAAPTTKASAAPDPQPAAHEIVTEVDAAMNDKAQALFKEGNTHFRAALYAKAHAAYTAALVLDPRNQKIVNNLGTTELELKQHRDAAEHLAMALRLADPNDPKRTKIQATLAEARARVGTVNLKVQAGGQALDGVEIVDMETGKSYTTPLLDPIFVDAKKMTFRIRREGYESQEKVFELNPGEETTADITLDRPAGYVGGPAATTTSTVGPGPAPRSKLPGFIGLGVGGAALVAGGALLGVALAEQSALINDTPKDSAGKPTCRLTAVPGEDASCADIRSRADSGSLMGNVGIGLLIGGGVVAVASVIYLVLPPGKPSSTGKVSRVIPVAGQNGGGLVLTGSF